MLGYEPEDHIHKQGRQDQVGFVTVIIKPPITLWTGSCSGDQSAELNGLEET